MTEQPTSPGATDPRIKAMVTEWDHRAGYELHPLERHVRAFLAAADAADRAADIVRVDTRDEALESEVYDWITDGYHVDDADLRYSIGLVFRALAALRGEQP